MAPANDAQRKSSDGFEGAIAGLGLADVIQLHSQNRFSGCITVQHGQRRGLLFFREGDVIHAEQGSKVGEEAFYDILGWPAGRFDLQQNVATTSATVHKSAQHLLLEAHRILDERRARAPAQATPPPSPVGRPATARELLDRVGAIPGVAHAVLLARDGTPIGDDGYEAEQLAGVAVYLRQLVGDRVGAAFQAGAVQVASVRGATHHLLVFASATQCLAVRVRGDGQIGAVEAEVRRMLTAGR